MYNYIILSTKVKKKGKAMETKDEVIRELDKKIDTHKTMIRGNISYLQDALDEMDSSLYIMSYLSLLKDDLTKNDGV